MSKESNDLIKISILNDFLINKNKYLLDTQPGHIGVKSSYSRDNEGEYNEYFKFYKHPQLNDGFFFKETYITDSYGHNEQLNKLEIVKGKEKTITVYEPI